MTRPDWRTGDPLDEALALHEEGRTEDAVRAIVAEDETAGWATVAHRLGVSQHAARRLLRDIGHAGRRGRKPRGSLEPERWLRYDDPRLVLAACAEALLIRAERGQGIAATEAAAIGRVLREASGEHVEP